MNIQDAIAAYISSQPQAKRNDMQLLRNTILQIMPECKLWFLDGKNSENKIVANPNIGYGHQTIAYADGSNRPFYQIGISANTTGISIYIMGIKVKQYLSKTFADKIGKASVTRYCIKFKSVNDINIDVLEDAIKQGFEATSK